MSTVKNTLSIAMLGSLSAAASAGTPIASFTYSDLLGSYNANTGVYSAVAGSTSAGDVTRFGAGGGSADFNTGFLDTPTSADYALELMLGNITGSNATGNGTLTITDDNGDTLTAMVTGGFRLFGGSVAYEGLLSDVFFNDLSGDGSFDGTSSGSFSNSFIGQPYSGSTISLFFDPGSFFGGSFTNEVTLSSGLVIPSPASFGGLALVGLVASIRRRR